MTIYTAYQAIGYALMLSGAFLLTGNVGAVLLTLGVVVWLESLANEWRGAR